ncbi:MAG: transglutaminase domain-containing protein [Lachnospiraceae bacterium]|nr:transglutaminase domain-containing protein [Lachnospiraceae bacterium]
MISILYDLLYMIPLCILVTAFGEPEFGGPEKSFWTFAVSLIVLGICITLKHWKNRMKYLIPGVIAALAAGIILVHAPEERVEFLWKSQWILWVSLASVGSFFAGWLWAASRTARRIFSAALLVGLIVLMVFWRTPVKAAVDIGFFMIILCVVDEIQHFWKKSGTVDAKGHMVSIAPFLLALGLLVFVLPAPENPYDWRFAVRIFEQASYYVKWSSKWFGGSGDDYSATIGFSDDGRFWSNLSKRDKTQMVLSAKRDAGDVIYLRGKVMDTFDGRNWTSTYEEQNRDAMMDTIETLCAVTKYDEEYIRNYLWRVELRLKYEDFTTKYFFTPLKPVLGIDLIGENPYVQQGGDLLSPETSLGYKTEYAIIFYRMNQDHTGFQEFLRNAEAPDRETWEAVRTRYEPLDVVKDRNAGTRDSGTSYEDYLEYRERTYEYYLQDVELPKEVSEYLDQLFETATSDFDKLARIEAFLASMEYTDTPGRLPDSVDSPTAFLDYFLRSKQEGYCSYFATAFVLLARSQGIPARYVQGFYVDKFYEEVISVKSGMAHAWPEAYLDGIGWVTFEPTPGKKYINAWTFKKKVTDSGVAQAPAPTPPTETLDPDKILEGPAEGEEIKEINWGLVLIPVGLVILFLLAFLLLDFLLVRLNYRKLDDAGRFSLSCRKNQRILGYLGYHMEDGETLAEFHERVSDDLGEEPLGYLLEHELIAYAGKQADAASLALVSQNLAALLVLLKEAKGRWYFWYRYQIYRMDAGKK